MFYSMELLHCLRKQDKLKAVQVSGAVCMFAFMLVSNRGTGLFYHAWKKFFKPECKEYQSFAIVKEFLDENVPFNVRTELYTLQTTLEWPVLELNPSVQLPTALKRVFCYDAGRAHAVYAVLLYKAMHEQHMSPNRLVAYAINNWNTGIFNRVVAVGMVV